MSCSIYAELSWLPQPPVDFNARCRSLVEEQRNLGGAVRALANHRLSENQLFRLSQSIKKARETGRSLYPLEPFRLGLISNANIDFLVPAITATAARHGIAVQIFRSEYGQVMQEALSAESVINENKPDAVLLALDYRWFPLQSCPGNLDEANSTVNDCLGQLEAIRSGIKAHSGAICIFQTLAAPVEGLFGSLDRSLPGTLTFT